MRGGACAGLGGPVCGHSAFPAVASGLDCSCTQAWAAQLLSFSAGLGSGTRATAAGPSRSPGLSHGLLATPVREGQRSMRELGQSLEGKSHEGP